MDKTAKHGNPKGPAYCDKPGTSCYYAVDHRGRTVCVNCLRPRGWRVTKRHRARLDRIAGR